MVVTRKKKDNKGAKKSNVSVSPGLEVDQQRILEPLAKAGFDKEKGGSNIAKGPKGKRKAQAEISLSPSSSPTRLDSHPSSVSDGFDSSGPVQTFNEGFNLESRGIIKSKPNSSSIKGNKEAARARALQHAPKSTAKLKDNVLAPTDWFASISTLKAKQTGEFRFGANSNTQVGDQVGKDDCGNSESDNGRNPSSPSTHLGLVQSQATDTMDIVVPPSDRGCLGIDERADGSAGALLDFDAWQRTNKGRSTNGWIDFDRGGKFPSSF